MSIKTIVFLVSILFGIWSSKATGPDNCRDEKTGGPNPNACSGVYDGTGKPLPNCMNVGATDATPVWMCSRCSHNCDCGEGQYCPKGPGQFAGTCRNIADDGKIGKSCASFGTPGSLDSVKPTAGVDDRLVCGAPIFDSNGTFLRYDWIGECYEGVCYECSGGPLGWVIDTTKSVSTTFCTTSTDRRSYLARDSGSLVCKGSYCRSGKVSKSSISWTIDVWPHGIMAGILAFTILIFIFMTLSCIWKCCVRSKRNPLNIFKVLSSKTGTPVRLGKLNDEEFEVIDAEVETSMVQQKKQ